MSFNFGSEVAIKRNHKAHTLTFDIIAVFNSIIANMHVSR